MAYGTFSAVKMEQHIGTITDFDLSFLDGFRLYDPQVNVGVRTNAGIPVLLDIAYVKAYRETKRATRCRVRRLMPRLAAASPPRSRYCQRGRNAGPVGR